MLGSVFALLGRRNYPHVNEPGLACWVLNDVLNTLADSQPDVSHGPADPCVPHGHRAELCPDPCSDFHLPAHEHTSEVCIKPLSLGLVVTQPVATCYVCARAALCASPVLLGEFCRSSATLPLWQGWLKTGVQSPRDSGAKPSSVSPGPSLDVSLSISEPHL